jgi:hypothetical protein
MQNDMADDVDLLHVHRIHLSGYELGWFQWVAIPPASRYRLGCGRYRPLVLTWRTVWSQVIPPAQTGRHRPHWSQSGLYRLVGTDCCCHKRSIATWHVLIGFRFLVNATSSVFLGASLEPSMKPSSCVT